MKWLLSYVHKNCGIALFFMNKAKKVNQTKFRESPGASTSGKVIIHTSVFLPCNKPLLDACFCSLFSRIKYLVTYWPRLLLSILQSFSLVQTNNDYIFLSTLLNVKLETKIRIYRLEVTDTLLFSHLYRELSIIFKDNLP